MDEFNVESNSISQLPVSQILGCSTSICVDEFLGIGGADEILVLLRAFVMMGEGMLMWMV